MDSAAAGVLEHRRELPRWPLEDFRHGWARFLDRPRTPSPRARDLTPEGHALQGLVQRLRIVVPLAGGGLHGLGRRPSRDDGRSVAVPLTGRLRAALQAIKHLKSELVLCHRDGSPSTQSAIEAALRFGCKRAVAHDDAQGRAPGAAPRSEYARPDPQKRRGPIPCQNRAFLRRGRDSNPRTALAITLGRSDPSLRCGSAACHSP
jgi:hypothetical protein